MDWLRPVQKRLDEIQRVECKFHTIHRLKLSEQIAQLDIAINESDATKRWGRAERFKLYFSNEDIAVDTLFITNDSYHRKITDAERFPVSSAEEIEALIQKIKVRQERNGLREKKSAKISTLKESGMKARLRELANEIDFSFAIGQNARNVNLSIRVAGKKTGFHFSFPKGKFDAMIEQIPELITNFETMANLGITFRTHNRKWQQGDWIFQNADDDDDYE